MYDGFSMSSADAGTAGTANGSATPNAQMSPANFEQTIALMNTTNKRVGDAQA